MRHLCCDQPETFTQSCYSRVDSVAINATRDSVAINATPRRRD